MSTAIEIETDVCEEFDHIEPCDQHLIRGCEGIALYIVRCWSCRCEPFEDPTDFYFCGPCARYFDRPLGETTCARCGEHFATVIPLRK